MYSFSLFGEWISDEILVALSIIALKKLGLKCQDKRCNNNNNKSSQRLNNVGVVYRFSQLKHQNA